MGEIRQLARVGDVKIAWNSENDKEIAVAREAFDKMIKDGWTAFREKMGIKGDKIRIFDPDAERILLVPPISGGQCTYNSTNTCERCEKELVNGARREQDENRNWTGRWICIECNNRNYYYIVRKKDPNSQNNLKKSLSDIRTGNLNPNSNIAKGRILEEVTVRTRGVENLNIENLRAKIDHSPDKEYRFNITQIRL